MPEGFKMEKVGSRHDRIWSKNIPSKKSGIFCCYFLHCGECSTSVDRNGRQCESGWRWGLPPCIGWPLTPKVEVGIDKEMSLHAISDGNVLTKSARVMINKSCLIRTEM